MKGWVGELEGCLRHLHFLINGEGTIFPPTSCPMPSDLGSITHGTLGQVHHPLGTALPSWMTL